jgi:predicted enzyme related to lactoylglutathione lyase
MAAAGVIYVLDVARMAAFYQSCFGMSPAEPDDDDGYCVLESGDWELSFVRMPADIAATVVITRPPRRRSETPLKLAFEVPSIDRILPVITAAGGQAEPAGPAWDFRGYRHLDCLDPEGNVVQLRERRPA